MKEQKHHQDTSQGPGRPPWGLTWAMSSPVLSLTISMLRMESRVWTRAKALTVFRVRGGPWTPALLLCSSSAHLILGESSWCSITGWHLVSFLQLRTSDIRIIQLESHSWNICLFLWALGCVWMPLTSSSISLTNSAWPTTAFLASCRFSSRSLNSCGFALKIRTTNKLITNRKDYFGFTPSDIYLIPKTLNPSQRSQKLFNCS